MHHSQKDPISAKWSGGRLLRISSEAMIKVTEKKIPKMQNIPLQFVGMGRHPPK